jgi:hypothetical protein
LEPREIVDHCPLHWIDTHLVDANAARIWKAALEKQTSQDSPNTARLKNASTLSNKRVMDIKMDIKNDHYRRRSINVHLKIAITDIKNGH